MSDCSRLSDRMPAVALGRSTWSEEESSHLADCGSCQHEWDVVRVSSRLGQGIGADLDPAAVIGVVLQRLAHHRETVQARRSWGFAVLSGAAAAAVILWAGRSNPVRVLSSPPATVASLQIQLPELDNLLPAELNTVLQTMDEPYVGGSDDAVAGDSDDEELESGFDTWEG
jgi:hypothetical protein